MRALLLTASLASLAISLPPTIALAKIRTCHDTVGQFTNCDSAMYAAAGIKVPKDPSRKLEKSSGGAAKTSLKCADGSLSRPDRNGYACINHGGVAAPP